MTPVLQNRHFAGTGRLQLTQAFVFLSMRIIVIVKFNNTIEFLYICSAGAAFCQP